MKLSKMHMVLQLVLLLGVSVSAQANPSVDDRIKTTETTEIEGMQFKATYPVGDRECAVKQGKEVKAAFDKFKFRTMLENGKVKVERIEIIAKNDYSARFATASLSKNGKVLYVRAYRPWTKVTVSDGYEMDRDWNRPMYSLPKVKVVDTYNNCLVLSEQELLKVADEIEADRNGSSQSETKQVAPEKSFLVQ